MGRAGSLVVVGPGGESLASRRLIADQLAGMGRAACFCSQQGHYSEPNHIWHPDVVDPLGEHYACDSNCRLVDAGLVLSARRRT